MSLLTTYKKLKYKQWAFILIFWMFITVIITNQLYFSSIKNGLDPSWLNLFLAQIPIWTLWMLATPAVLFVVNKYPFETENWSKALGAYLISGLVLLFLLTNLTLVYMFSVYGYIDLGNTTFGEYSPYFFSRLTNDFLIYALVVMIFVIARSYSVRKSNQLNLALMNLKNNQLKSQLTQAQLQALKLQLNPHFLFNTLNTITSLTLVGKNSASINMTSKLGDFLRRTLDFEDHQLVTLAKELEFFDLYLEIESIRFKDRIILKREVEPSSLTQNVPNLILQPLIENAIKYGIAKKKDARLVELKISKRDGFLEVELFNEGPFLPSDLKSRKGVGLRNIESRLSKLYDKQHLFEIANDEIRGGVKSTVRLPADI